MFQACHEIAILADYSGKQGKKHKTMPSIKKEIIHAHHRNRPNFHRRSYGRQKARNTKPSGIAGAATQESLKDAYEAGLLERI
jgi:hypothetical protein